MPFFAAIVASLLPAALRTQLGVALARIGFALEEALAVSFVFAFTGTPALLR